MVLTSVDFSLLRQLLNVGGTWMSTINFFILDDFVIYNYSCYFTVSLHIKISWTGQDITV